MPDDPSLRDRLRQVPTVTATFPYFDTDAAPDEPLPLLVEWIEAAIDGDVLQPLAMALATSTVDGHPSNRTLLLKDVDDSAIWFASLSSGPKGLEIAENPEAAAVLYWREQGRQVRLVGTVEEGPRSISERDFRERQPNARARAIAGRQSEPVDDFDAHLRLGKRKLDANPDYVPIDWVAYRLTPWSVEFWQAERERDQVRLRYLREHAGWVKDLLWP
ncbi:MAG TPA: pyridoxamine 5'-phosphate oxidase family protein [Galbitalea sp.]|jgi:pyridoxamine 5'-phosphate oxidase